MFSGSYHICYLYHTINYLIELAEVTEFDFLQTSLNKFCFLTMPFQLYYWLHSDLVSHFSATSDYERDIDTSLRNYIFRVFYFQILCMDISSEGIG